jgi:hypothetical protein
LSGVRYDELVLGTSGFPLGLCEKRLRSLEDQDVEFEVVHAHDALVERPQLVLVKRAKRFAPIWTFELDRRRSCCPWSSS